LVREYMRELVFQVRKMKDITALMTSEIPTGENKISRFGVEEYLASGVIKLELQEYRGFVFRVMFIRKMRWTAVRPQKLVFEIYPHYGIYIIDRLENFMKQVDMWYAMLNQQLQAPPLTQ
jgi:circadian clock protein KaiC